MPLEKIETSGNRTWGVWRIDEAEHTLAIPTAPFEKLSDTITHPIKRLEWLAGRILVKRLAEELLIEYKGITKDDFGKPFLVGSTCQVALTHAYPYVAALLDKATPVGIDIEQPKTKLLKIAPRVLCKNELYDAGADIIKHCIYWCAKETLIKVYGKKNLTLAKDLKIDPFNLANEGRIIGSIVVLDHARIIPLQYMVTANYVLVLSSAG